MRALLAGAGAVEALASPGGEGRVLAWFPKACYLEFPAGLVALVGPGVHAGPLHLGLDCPPPRTAPGATARATAAGIAIGRTSVGVAGAEPWTGSLPDPEVVEAAAPLIAECLTEAAGRCLVPPQRAAGAVEHLAAGDLAGAARILTGAGPGLTPAGDDALAGILFGLRARGGPPAQAKLVSVAATAETTTLSKALLLWAARGQALAPVHALLEAGAVGDAPRAGAAAAMLGAVGHSSGADFAQGLLWGLARRRSTTVWIKSRAQRGNRAKVSSSQAVHITLPAPPNLQGR